MARPATGFILPTVLVVSLVILALGLSLVQTTSSISRSLADVNNNRLATEASDSGIVYANYCLNKNGSQTWGPAVGKPNLTQSTDCSGTTNAKYPKYFATGTNFQTTFNVGDLQNGQIETATGTFMNIFTSGGTTTVLGSLNAYQKQTVKQQSLQASYVTAGRYKSCGIVSSVAYCWGMNSGSFAGELGDGTTNDTTTPVKVYTGGAMAGKTPTIISAGYAHVCALASSTVFCWGQNNTGQLGNNSTTQSLVPVQVGGLLAGQTVTDVAVADGTTCAIANAKIYCWGDNSYGTAGTGSSSTSQYLVPQELTAGLPANYTAAPQGLAISDSESMTMCAIVNSQAYCWGDDRAGAIGNNTSTNTPVWTPTAVSTANFPSGTTVKTIAVDGYDHNISNTLSSHVCVLLSNNQIYCWGDNDYGQLGLGNQTQYNTPQHVTAFASQSVQAIAAGVIHTCALSNGTVYCWGDNVYGQLGTNQSMYTSTYDMTPTAIVDANHLLTGKTITQVYGGANRTCIIADYSTYCWGLNGNGQVGDGTTINRNVPVLSKFLEPPMSQYLF